MLAFRPLTPSARSGNLIAGDGTKNGLFRSEQRTVSKTQTTISDQTANREGKALDRKSPIQVSSELGAELNYIYRSRRVRLRRL